MRSSVDRESLVPTAERRWWSGRDISYVTYRIVTAQSVITR